VRSALHGAEALMIKLGRYGGGWGQQMPQSDSGKKKSNEAGDVVWRCWLGQSWKLGNGFIAGHVRAGRRDELESLRCRSAAIAPDKTSLSVICQGIVHPLQAEHSLQQFSNSHLESGETLAQIVVVANRKVLHALRHREGYNGSGQLRPTTPG
jgi:hypothetical protein